MNHNLLNPTLHLLQACASAAGEKHRIELRASVEPSPSSSPILHPLFSPQSPPISSSSSHSDLVSYFTENKLLNRRNQQRLITASLPSHPVPIYSASWYGQIAFKSHPSMRHYLSRVLLQHVSPFPPKTSTVFLSTGSSWAAYWLSLKIKTVGLHLSL